jgi:hypothetical protein
MKRRVGCGLVMLAAAACTTTPRPAVQNPEPTSMAELAMAIEADAQRSDHESDPAIRRALAAEASRHADACTAREPQAVGCIYGRAIALGLEARAYPLRAGELLKSMLADLARAESTDPNYDEAGPARVQALILLRAPGWPLGPGDPAAGLDAAGRAVKLQPRYPPNVLALAEALAKSGDAMGAQEAYSRARDAALAFPEAADRDDWLRQANEGLQRRQ